LAGGICLARRTGWEVIAQGSIHAPRAGAAGHGGKARAAAPRRSWLRKSRAERPCCQHVRPTDIRTAYARAPGQVRLPPQTLRRMTPRPGPAGAGRYDANSSVATPATSTPVSAKGVQPEEPALGPGRGQQPIASGVGASAPPRRTDEPCGARMPQAYPAGHHLPEHTVGTAGCSRTSCVTAFRPLIGTFKVVHVSGALGRAVPAVPRQPAGPRSCLSR
jgi:hypothetical protein